MQSGPSATENAAPERATNPLSLLKHLGWIALCLIIAEPLLEIRAHVRGWNTILFGAPSLELPEASQDQTWGPTPSFPFRSRVILEDADPDTPRIWFASASFGEDVRVARNLVFPNQVESLLVSDSVESHVLNASRRGLDVPANTVDLDEIGARWRPQVVVLYQMATDITYLSKNTSGDANSNDGGGMPAEPDVLQSLLNGGLVEEFVENTSIFALLKGNLSPRLTEAKILKSTLSEENRNTFERSIRDFVARCRHLDAVAVLCTFATSHNRSNVDRIPDEYRWNQLKFNPHLSMDGWVKTIAEWNDVIRHVADDEDVQVIDLVRTVGGRHEFFRDFVHFNERGHHRMAVLIAASLRDVLSGGGDL